MSNDKLAEALGFLDRVHRGMISGRISEWPGLREACGIVYAAHAAEAAQAQAQAAEPVVWMTPTKNYFGSFEGCTDACNGAPIPLYTHPQDYST